MADTTQSSNRKTLIGYVVSNKMDKTIVVEVTRQKSHPMYQRVMKRSKKFYAQDDENTCRIGDVVKIEETRPLSKLKRWRLVEVLRRATIVPGELKSATTQTPEAQA